ncbi:MULTISPECIES: oxygenase MpaB family protein [Pseudofrankia]|uniref:oxygenase MpaB family protein n=1 Tax=Pseudofrankia TaxID=2994363 RepID=UPI000234CA04|nr:MULTISPECIES: oxygenase MpaB family protein [Pseudofrankia]OHV34111.1 Latex clearing protein [Pseudofrankia sp. EUN1h]
MSELSRRRVLTLGAALGLVGVGDVVAPTWSWAATGSVAGTGTGTDPQWVWDDTIDRVMASVIDNGQVPAVNAAILPWTNNNAPLPTGLPADLASYLQQATKLPSWADMSLLRRAADFNRRKDTYLFMLYGLGSGIMSTVIPREARAVYWSEGSADMKSRAAKTFTFGYDLSQSNAFEPNGQFVVTANKTRMVHAAVRHLLPQSPQWKAAATENVPISNGDILVTFHSLGTFVHSKLQQWKVPMSKADENAFLHMWQVAISLLGVKDEYIPKTWADTHAQSAQVLSPILMPTTEGRNLAEVLLGLVSEVDLGVTRGFLNEFARYVLGDAVADSLGLPRDLVSAGIIKVGWPTYILFREGLLPIMPVNFYLFDQFIRAVAMAFLNGGTSTQTTPITIPDINRPAA